MKTQVSEVCVIYEVTVGQKAHNSTTTVCTVGYTLQYPTWQYAERGIIHTVDHVVFYISGSEVSILKLDSDQDIAVYHAPNIIATNSFRAICTSACNGNFAYHAF